MQLFFKNENTGKCATIECDKDDTVGQIRAKIEEKCGSEVSAIFVSRNQIGGMARWHDARELFIGNTNLDEEIFCTLVDKHCGSVGVCSHFSYRTTPVEHTNLVELEKNARIFAQARWTNTGPSFFKDLPLELQAKIASFTGDFSICDEKSSFSIAADYITSLAPSNIDALLEKYKTDSPFIAFRRAAFKDNVSDLRSLITEIGIANIDDSGESSGNTALHVAAQKECFEACVYLLQAGANVFAQNNSDQEPLDLVGGQNDDLKELFQHYINIQDEQENFEKSYTDSSNMLPF